MFLARHADTRDPGQQALAAVQLREHGLVTFGGIRDRAELQVIAARFMTIRPHRDSGPDGVTVIASTGKQTAGYAAFTDRELVPHTDGSGVADPPGLLLLLCLRPATAGGSTVLADGAEVAAALARAHPAALPALSSPQAAIFGGSNGYRGPIIAPGGPGRCSIRFRSDELARFSDSIVDVLPLLTASITKHVETIQLHAGEGILLSNTRWLHGRTRYTGQRVMLRILGDPLPSTGIQPGFPVPPAVGRHISGQRTVADAA